MAEANINVRVNAQKARQDLNLTTESVENLTVNVAIQQQKIAEANQEVVKYTRLLGNAGSGAEQMKFQSALKTANENLADQRAGLKSLNAELNAAKVQRKLNTKATEAGTIKAVQFNESLLKNRDISTGLSKITGGLSYQIQSFGKLFLSVGKGVRNAAAAMSLFQKALLATGIGAVVVSVGFLAANFEKVKNFITGANPELEKLEASTERLVTTTKNEITLLQKQKELLKLQGENTEEVNKLLLQKFEIQKGNLLILLDELEAQLQIEKEEAKRVTFFEKIKTGLKFFLDTNKGVEEAVKSISDENEKTLELTEKIQDTRNKILDLDINIVQINKEETEEEEKQLELLDKQLQKEQQILRQKIENTISAEAKIGQIRRDFFKRNLEDRQAEIEIEREEQIKRIKDSEANEIAKRMALAEVNKFYDNLQTKREEKASKDAVKIKEIEQQQKLAVIGSTLATATNILGKNTKAGKAAGVASALVNTYQGVTQVWKSESVLPEPFATIQKIASTAVVLASGLSAVKQIKSVSTSGSGATAGGGAGGGLIASAPSIQSSAPSFNIVGAAPENQLAQTISAQQQKPVKAFVVAGDVTTAQGLERNIVQESSLG